jgi:hypothetical protein
MMTLYTLFFMLLCCTPSPLPPPRIPTGTLVIKESFQAPGPDRSGNWWGRFDDSGCFWEGHNSSLVVTDELLSKSSAYLLYWNGVEPENPWFCLAPTQLAALQTLIEALPKPSRSAPYRGPVDRWSIIGPDGPKSVVISADDPSSEWQALTDLFRLLSSVSVWGPSRQPTFG